MSTPHQMTRTRSLKDSTEEWSCTQCSRRLLLRRPPAFEKVVLDRGDEWAAHVGGVGGIQMAGAQTSPAPARGLRAQERNWLSAHGIDWGSDETS